jgi:predicted RNase H-like nuclease (RuvC/YqgF family)
MTEANRPLDTMDEVAYRELEAENKKLKKKVHDAELETSLVKAIGINSPEMKALRQKNQELKKEICELRSDNRKLAAEVEDRVDRMRKAALI